MGRLLLLLPLVALLSFPSWAGGSPGDSIIRIAGDSVPLEELAQPVRAKGESMLTTDDSFARAGRAYNAAHFDSAIMIYEGIAQQGKCSGNLYYNLGNAYYRAGNGFAALLNYERALKFEPGHRAALRNLAVVRGANPTPPWDDERGLLARLGRWYHIFTSGTWGWLSLIFLALSLGGALLLRFRVGQARVLGVAFASGLLFVLSVVSFAGSRMKYNSYWTSRYALVKVGMAMVKSSPVTTSQDLLRVGQGAKLRIEQRAGNWYEVTMPDGTRGWIGGESVEEI